MNSTEKLQQLEIQLEQTTTQYKSDAVFSEDNLKELQSKAIEKHPRHEQFHCYGPRHLALTLQDKLPKGYTYLDHQASALPLANGDIVLQLQRPDDAIQTELVELEKQVKDKYLLDISDNESRLSTEIAKLRLQIKQTKSAITLESKEKTDFEKELAKVKQELLSSSDKVQSSQEVSNG